MSQYDLIIHGGRIVDPANDVDYIGDIGVKDKKIVDIGVELKNYKAERFVNAAGSIVIPGIIDSHCHLAYMEAEGAGYRMLVKAGVTTAVDFEGPIDAVVKDINYYGCGLNVAVLEAIYPGKGVNSNNPNLSEIKEGIEKYLNKGALGIKILGGHYPLTPRATAEIIDVTNKNQAYVGFHAGTTETGSNILGMEEAVKLADKKPLHIAHINAYCRGTIGDQFIELKRALDILEKNKNIVSESHLAPFNVCAASFDKSGCPNSAVTKGCLQNAGYEVGLSGMSKAIKDQYAGIHIKKGREMKIIFGKEALDYWESNMEGTLASFPVNSRTAALVCASKKDKKGNFIVDAISSDGGALPRNYILKYGFYLIKFGALSINEFVKKVSLVPAKMFGFNDKGHLSIGADADIVIIKPDDFKVGMVIIEGNICAAENYLFERPGKILTTEMGAEFLRKQKISIRKIDITKSMFYKGKI